MSKGKLTTRPYRALYCSVLTATSYYWFEWWGVLLVSLSFVDLMFNI